MRISQRHHAAALGFGFAGLLVSTLASAQAVSLSVWVPEITRTVAFLLQETPGALKGVSAIDILIGVVPLQVWENPEIQTPTQIVHARHEERLLRFLESSRGPSGLSREIELGYLSVCRKEFAPALGVHLSARFYPASARVIGDYFVRQDNLLVREIESWPEVVSARLENVGALSPVESVAQFETLTFPGRNLTPGHTSGLEWVDQIILSHLLRPDVMVVITPLELRHLLAATGERLPSPLADLYLNGDRGQSYSRAGGHDQVMALYEGLSRTAKTFLAVMSPVSDFFSEVRAVIPGSEIERQVARASSDADRLGVVALNVHHLRLLLAPFVRPGRQGLALFSNLHMNPEDVDRLADPVSKLRSVLNILQRRIAWERQPVFHGVLEAASPRNHRTDWVLSANEVDPIDVEDELSELEGLLSGLGSGHP